MHRMILPLMVLIAVACQPAVDLENESATLRQTDLDFAAAASAGADVEQNISFWSDDATIIPPSAPAVQGKEAIREFVTQNRAIPGFHVTWEPSEIVIAPNGGFGYTTGTNEFTMPDADGNLVTTRGRYVTVWRREADGTWKCVMDIWNTAPADNPSQS